MSPPVSAHFDRRLRGLAVIGHGRAGRARVRAIEARDDLELRGIVTRGEALGKRAIEEVLRDPHVDAGIVCTENARHAAFVDALLEARKHVAVEFPLCTSAAEARRLYERSHEVDRLLHVEHIELLTEQHRERRRALPDLGAIHEAAITFQGGSDGWIVDPDLGGSPAHTGIARLHVLLDLFGPLVVRQAHLRRLDRGFELVVSMVALHADHPVTWTERRSSMARRSTSLFARGEFGELPIPVAGTAPGDLFGQDLDSFAESIRAGRSLAVEEEREIVALELADDVVRQLSSR